MDLISSDIRVDEDIQPANFSNQVIFEILFFNNFAH